MGISRVVEFLLPWLLLVLQVVPSAVLSQNNSSNCPTKCGDVDIPYPFGVGIGCAIDGNFSVSCKNSTSGNTKKAFLRDMEISKIVLMSNYDGYLRSEIVVLLDTYRACYNKSTGTVYSNIGTPVDLSGSPFTFSTKNRFVVTGCASTAYMTDSTGVFTRGCTSVCHDLNSIPNNTCSLGFGCCENSMTDDYSRLQYFDVVFDNYANYNLTSVATFNPCSYAFLVEEGMFDFNRSIITADEDLTMKLPVVIDWSTVTPGLPDISLAFQRTFQSKLSQLFVGLAGIGGGLFIVLFNGAGTLIYKLSKKRRKKQLRQKHFQQNHGLLLEQLIASDNDATERTKIFTLKELEKATNNFDRTRIIGDGGHGTVYKGMLLDQRVVAIKRSKLTKQFEIDQFINEVALLSRINHRNVVKIFGCCLESEVPLLVYEFIGNGTLTDHLHVSNHTSYLGWDDRLRIATEVVGAISYLHFASSKSIIHRDLKSSNILLDEKLTAKVADFGASKSVKSDETHITTAVQGTFGYLDPEYFQTGKLTDKSDVYSMGVILVELLTGQKPVSRVRAQEERNLIMHFIWLLREKQISQIFEESLTKEATKEDLEVVAELAGSCVRLKGEERPSMKEVETTLEVLKRSRTKQKRQVNREEETESLLSYETPTNGNQATSFASFSASQSFLR